MEPKLCRRVLREALRLQLASALILVIPRRNFCVYCMHWSSTNISECLPFGRPSHITSTCICLSQLAMSFSTSKYDHP